MSDRQHSVLGLRVLAKELAGQFYEAKRSDKFRSKDALVRARRMFKNEATGLMEERIALVKFHEAYPTAEAYASAHWPFFYEAARKCYIGLLKQPDSRINQHMKDQIMATLLEDNERSQRSGENLVQQSVRNHDRAAAGFR